MVNKSSGTLRENKTDAFDRNKSQVENRESNRNSYSKFSKLSKLPELSAVRAVGKGFQLPLVISRGKKQCR